MKKIIYLIFVLIISLILSNSANALIVGHQNIAFDFPIYGEQLPFTHYDLNPGNQSRDTWIEYNPFGTVEVYSAGDSFIADSSTTQFSNAVSLLTNDIRDYIHGGWPYPLFTPEPNLLYGPGFSDPDFMGSQINSMSLVVNAFSFTILQTPTPGGVGGGHIDYTITYEHNPVPIPAAIYLLGAGFVGIAGLRRKIKK